jgi:hypothetical protein
MARAADKGESRTDLDAVKDAIRDLPHEDRAAFRPWLLAARPYVGHDAMA